MANFTAFNTVGQAGDTQLTDAIRSNMQAYIDWAALGMGWFLSVTTGTRYPYGFIPSKLRLADDSRIPAGTAWDGFKTNWIWENNIENTVQPIQISGVYVNGSFYPSDTSGTYAHNVNYPLGRIVFTNAISTNSVVQAEFSYKYYNVYPDTVNWFKQLTKGTFRGDDPQFRAYGSGIWSVFPDSRAQLPAVVIEPVPKHIWQPLAIGGGTWIWRDVLLHIFSETPAERDNLLDIFSYQTEKKIFMFDKNAMSRGGAFPLSANGYLVNPSSTYPYLLDNYLWRFCIIRDTNIQRSENDPQGIYWGSAKWTLQIEFPEI